MWTKVFFLFIQNYLVFISLFSPQSPTKHHLQVLRDESKFGCIIYLLYIQILNISFLILSSCYLISIWCEEYMYLNDIIPFTSHLSYWTDLDLIFIPLTTLGALIRLICLRPHDKIFSLPSEIPLPLIRAKTVIQNAFERINNYLQFKSLTISPILPSSTTSTDDKEAINSFFPLTPPPSSLSFAIIASSSTIYDHDSIKELILKDDYQLFDLVQFPQYTGLIIIWFGRIYLGWRLCDFYIFSSNIKKSYWNFALVDLIICIIGLWKIIKIEKKIMEREFGKKRWRELTRNNTKEKIIPYIF